MALSSTPTETSQLSEEKKLSSESQARVDNVVTEVNKIFDANPNREKEAYKIIKTQLQELILKTPGKLAEILDQIDQRYQKRLEWFGYKTYERRQEAIDQYTNFLTEMGKNITSKALNVKWQDEYKDIEKQYLSKKDSLIGTYKNIIQDLKPTK
jgi:hypothetical protein